MLFQTQQSNKFTGQQRAIVNKTPLWKYILLLVILLAAIIYALPNLYGTNPAVQVSSSTPGVNLTQQQASQMAADLKKANLSYKNIAVNGKHVVISFSNVDTRLSAKDLLTKSLGDAYIVAGTDMAATPSWLNRLNAKPMKLGLDLRGGMSLLLQVDVNDVIKRREQNNIRVIGEALRSNHILYTGIMPTGKGIQVHFADKDAAAKAQSALTTKAQEFVWKQKTTEHGVTLMGVLSPKALTDIRQYTIQQTINTLNRRVNELGVSEAAVQQQGVDRISVDLPGVSDATEAQDILGKTATIETHLVDIKHDAQQADASGVVPAGDILLKNQAGQPFLLDQEVVLSGDNITSASSTFDQSGQPTVNITVAGPGQALLYKTTSESIGKPMAVVYTEVKSNKTDVNGKPKITYRKISYVINVATIQGAFSANFQITGLSSAATAQQLALLLRAGSLPAPVTVLSEQQVGPSMGKQNVERGKLSVEIGMLVVMVFMLLYYRKIGFIADIGLVINLILIVAIMSLLGGTMTFPGIAGIVLTVGMAVDANVLIYERIREELRNGLSVQAAIHAGYDRAVITIVDAQLTTLIAAVVLFGVGDGPIKGFAITLTIGLLTSMLTGITYTRAIVNAWFGGRALKHLSIGIKVKR